MRTSLYFRAWVILLLMALGLLVLERTSLDWHMALWAFDAERGGFVWRNQWWTAILSHRGLKIVSGLALFYAWSTLIVGWGPLGRLPRASRAYVAINASVCLLMIAWLKSFSPVHCPWDIQGLGGTYPYLHWWQSFAGQARPGRCFPAGHASVGFAFLGTGWAFWQTRRRWAWTAIGLASGLGLWAGLAQQWRGAHFMSHTLWTAWCCAVAATLLAQFWRLTLRPSIVTPVEG